MLAIWRGRSFPNDRAGQLPRKTRHDPLKCKPQRLVELLWHRRIVIAFAHGSTRMAAQCPQLEDHESATQSSCGLQSLS